MIINDKNCEIVVRMVVEEKCQWDVEDKTKKYYHVCHSPAEVMFRGYEEKVNHYFCLRHFSIVVRIKDIDDGYLVHLFDDSPLNVEGKNGTLWKCYGECHKYYEGKDMFNKSICNDCKAKIKEPQVKLA